MITEEQKRQVQAQNKKSVSRATAAKKAEAEKAKWNADDDALIRAFNAGVMRRQALEREVNVTSIPEKGNDIDINVNVEKESAFGSVVMALTMCAVAVDLIIHLVNML